MESPYLHHDLNSIHMESNSPVWGLHRLLRNDSKLCICIPILRHFIQDLFQVPFRQSIRSFTLVLGFQRNAIDLNRTVHLFKCPRSQLTCNQWADCSYNQLWSETPGPAGSLTSCCQGGRCFSGWITSEVLLLLRTTRPDSATRASQRSLDANY